MFNITFYCPFWLLQLRPSSKLMTSRDAVDKRFQRTLDVLTGKTIGELTSWAQELSIDVINIAFYCPFWLLLLRLSSELMTSRDAVDERFQHTLDVLTGITMGQLNAQVQELSIDMLHCIHNSLIDPLLLIWNRVSNSPFLPKLLFLRFFVRGKQIHHRWVENPELTYARLAAECGKSDFDADFCSRSHMVSYILNICRSLSPQLLTSRQKF